MNPTNIEIGEHYGLDRKTIGTYKNSEDPKVRNRYDALKEFYIKAYNYDKGVAK